MHRLFARAFTLIELLVVVAVISVLAALLMPALRGALKAARVVTCINNEKQLSQALFGYVENWDGVRCPAIARYDLSNTNIQVKWGSAFVISGVVDTPESTVRRVIGGSNWYRWEGIWGCPEALREGSWTMDMGNRYNSRYSMNHVSIFLEVYPWWTLGGSWDNKFIRPARLGRSSQTIMFEEDNDWHCNRANAGQPDVGYRWHDGRGAKVWYDGHAGMYTLEEIYDDVGSTNGGIKEYYYYGGIPGQKP